MKKVPESSPAGRALIKLRHIRDYCNQRVFEREEEVNGAIVALLSGVSCLYIGDAGAAKEQPVSSLVQTPDGPRTIGSLRVGDKIFGKSGKVITVKGVYPQGVKDVYELTFRDGSTARCGIGHLWAVRERSRGTEKVMSLEDILKRKIKTTRAYNYSVPLCRPLQYKKKKLPVHPYVLGVMLGNGCFRGYAVTISCADFDTWVMDKVKSLEPDYNFIQRRTGPSCLNFKVKDKNHKYGIHTMTDKIRELGLWNHKSRTKFIPEIYMTSSEEDRWHLLHGLMDTDGCMKKGNGHFCSYSPDLLNDVARLTESLGGIAMRHDGGRSLNIKTFRNQFSLPRKAQGWCLPKQNKITRSIIKIKKLRKKEEQVCIKVSAKDQLYLTDNCIVTHNTKLIKIIAQFTGLRLFEIQIHETTKPESIFGIPDIPSLAKGIQRQKIEGYAPTSEVMFFDEIFKAGGVVLNQLLTLLNEKQFKNGDDGILKVPLVSAFAASNEIPTDKGLRPLYDRFVLRFNIRYLQAEDNILRMMDARLNPQAIETPEPLTREELAMLSRNIKQVDIPEDVRKLIIKVRDQVQRGVKVVISDRRLDHTLHILQAQAFFNGRLEVRPRDLAILSHLFWDDPKDAYKVKAICMSSADAVGGDILSFEQLSQSVVEVAMESGDIQGGITKLREMLVTMKKFKSGATSIRNAVKNKLDQLRSIIDQRQQFVVLVMNEMKGGYWLKMSEGTAQNWTPAQIREMGFKQKRNGGYWYTDMSESALERRVMKMHKIEVMFRDIG